MTGSPECFNHGKRILGPAPPGSIAMPKRSRAPRAKIIEYKQLKTAAGGNGASGGGSGGGGQTYKLAQSLKCMVLAKMANGKYNVVIPEVLVPGTLMTSRDLKA